MLIPNGVGIRPAAGESLERLRARTGLNPGDEVVTFLGRLHPIKRLDLLADAFAIVHHARPKARLMIAGPDEGGYRQRVEALFAPVAAATHWLGPVDTTPSRRFWRRPMCRPVSDPESFGMSVAEG
jgi:glycosyltransferase involved in cell wall biosynthesis